MKKLILYFVDDTLEIVYNGKVIKEKLKNAINNGMIYDKERFAMEFVKIMKKEKVKIRLFGGSITIAKEPFYHPSYLFYLERVLEDIGFTTISYIDIQDLFVKDGIYIEVNNNYMIIYSDKAILIDISVFKDIPNTIEHILGLHDQNILLFGKNKNIPSVKLQNNAVYYFENYNNFITQSLLKVKKYDA